jgi:hypothetical protein
MPDRVKLTNDDLAMSRGTEASVGGKVMPNTTTPPSDTWCLDAPPCLDLFSCSARAAERQRAEELGMTLEEYKAEKEREERQRQQDDKAFMEKAARDVQLLTPRGGPVTPRSMERGKVGVAGLGFTFKRDSKRGVYVVSNIKVCLVSHRLPPFAPP